MKRRSLLQLSGLAPLAAGLSGTTLAAGHEYWYAIAGHEDHGLVLVDVKGRQFSGDGLYLYPDWGQPRAYHVKLRGRELLFSDPGQSRVLWRESLTVASTAFAGRVTATLNSSQAVAARTLFPALELASLPSRAGPELRLRS